jgi:hypothetical protein
VKRPPGRVFVATGMLVALSILVSACGVPTSSSPQALASVPVGLIAKGPPPFKGLHSGPVPCRIKALRASVYFIGAFTGQLVPVNTCATPTSEGLLESLLAGPSLFDKAKGIITFIENQGGVSIVKIKGEKPHVVTVNLGPSFTSPLAPQAIAQIVYTLTVSPVEEVAFYQLGRPVNVPTEAYIYVPRPVTRDDYSDLLESS